MPALARVAENEITLAAQGRTRRGNETGFLTASHCSSPTPGYGEVGRDMGQPTNQPNDIVGFVFLNPAFNRTDVECNGVVRCTDADVMFVKYNSPITATKRVAATKSVGTGNALGSIDRVSYWSNISSVPFAYVGMVVDKVGRTTGWTRGTLTETCVDRNIMDAIYPALVSFRLICVNKVSGAAFGGGDSGASVFYPLVSPDPLYAMGILSSGEGALFHTDIYGQPN